MEKKKLSIFILIFLFQVKGLYAQKVLEDSLGVLPMKKMVSDTLHLNQETLEAIKNGTLIHVDSDHRQLKEADSELYILKDFSEYIKPDTAGGKKFDFSLPPAVFSLYTFESDSGLYVHKQALTVSPSVVILPDRMKVGNLPITFTLGADNLFLKDVKDGQSRGSVGFSVRYCFSMEDALRYIFWKSHRDKLRNRKRTFTWQHYNNYP